MGVGLAVGCYNVWMIGDPFDVLGLAARFDVTPAEVRRAYLVRVAVAHPDRGDGGGEEGVDASALNAALVVLNDPEQRAAALLARLGGASKEADRSLPAGFLQEMMQLREGIDEAASAGDTAAVGRAIEVTRARREGHVAEVGRLFKSIEEGGGSSEAALLKAVRGEMNAWRYVERLIDQIGGQVDGQVGGSAGGGRLD